MLRRYNARMVKTRAVAIVLLVSACAAVAAAPKLKSSWRNLDPAAAPVSRIAVIGLTPDVATRRLMEDSLTAEIRKNSGQAEPSYSVIPGQLPKDAETLKAKIVAGKFDGAAVVRVAGVSQEQYWDTVAVAMMPGYYATPWNYWGHWYPYAWDPFYLRTDTTVRVETVVYAVSGTMIWTGLSESTNPGTVKVVIREVAVAAAADMKKRNVLKAGK
jgi:hypothetical protein